MRTTIDLPADVHRAALMLARDQGKTLSRTVADLLRAALAGGGGRSSVEFDDETGLPLLRLGHRITAEDVAGAQDEA